MEINSTDGLVLKSGSIITLSGSTYTTYTTTSDKSIKSAGIGKRVIFLTQSNYAFAAFKINNITSGITDGIAGEIYHVWFDTENKLIKGYTTSGDTVAYTCSYPLCVVETDSSGNVIGFVKDSNGNDMIFNGMGFIGHHAFVYPGVTGLIPNGKKLDGSLKTINRENNALRIIDLISNIYNDTLFLTNWSGYLACNKYNGEIENIENISDDNIYTFVKSLNEICRKYQDQIESNVPITPLVKYSHDDSTVIDFAIQQPLTKYRQVVKLVP